MGFFQNTQKPEGIGGRLMLQMMNSGHNAMATWGLSKLTIDRSWSALDAGCGGGANIKTLLKKCRAVNGIDHSPLSVETSTRNNIEAIKNGRCAITRGDVSHLPYEDAQFDLVTAFETIYFWPGPQESFAEVYRVLKPDGHFFICNESDGEDANGKKWEEQIQGMTVYTPDAVQQMLECVGFRSMRIVRRANKHWFCIDAQK